QAFGPAAKHLLPQEHSEGRQSSAAAAARARARKAALRLSAPSRVASSRRMGGQCEADLSSLLCREPDCASEEGAKEAGEPAARGTEGSAADERAVEHGLCCR